MPPCSKETESVLKAYLIDYVTSLTHASMCSLFDTCCKKLSASNFCCIHLIRTHCEEYWNMNSGGDALGLGRSPRKVMVGCSNPRRERHKS